MKTSLFLAFLPIVVSFFSLWVSYIQGSNKNKTTIIDSLSKELSAKKPNPYIIQVCISRIHNSRAIPFNVLSKLLCNNNAFEIIQLISVGKRVLDILKVSECNGGIVVGYTDAYRALKNRVVSMLLCVVAVVACYSSSVYMMLKMMFSIETISIMGNKNFAEWVNVFPKTMGLLFFMFMTFIFSWQFIIIFTSGRRIMQIQKLIDDHSIQYIRRMAMPPRTFRKHL